MTKPYMISETIPRIFVKKSLNLININEPPRAKARGLFNEILEWPNSIRAINGAVLWPRKYKNQRMSSPVTFLSIYL